MDYEALLHEILNIGEAMLKSGAEVDRAEDSMYRMCKSYDLISCEIFAIQSNIQATIRPKGGHYLTQIRRVKGTSLNYDRLDYLNNLSRYICHHTPEPAEIHERYLEVMNRKPQPKLLSHLAAIMGGAGFGVYFGVRSAGCPRRHPHLLPDHRVYRGLAGQTGKQPGGLQYGSFFSIGSIHPPDREAWFRQPSGPYYPGRIHGTDQRPGHHKRDP